VHTLTGLNPLDGRGIEISVRDGIIHGIGPGRCDEDVWLSAGFVDLQVNGYGGDDVNADEPSPETIISLTKKMIGLGVTTYLPTIITAPETEIIARLRAIAKARAVSPLVAGCVPFVHVEGPHLSPLDGYRGAHALEEIRPPDLAEFSRWQEACGGLVGMVTLSPHFESSEEYVAGVTKLGVHVALGHTHASAEEIRRAVDAGARLSTHLGNGIDRLIPRHLNPLWPQLAEDRLTATFIADGHHLPAEALKAMIRAKGVARCILVSDTVAVAGMAAGSYSTPVGGQVALQPDGRLCLAGTEFLAGAAVPLKDGIARASTMAGISLGNSVRMATVNPGRFAGGVGELKVGMRADLVRFRMGSGGMALGIERVLVKGEEWDLESA